MTTVFPLLGRVGVNGRGSVSIAGFHQRGDKIGT